LHVGSGINGNAHPQHLPDAVTDVLLLALRRGDLVAALSQETYGDLSGVSKGLLESTEAAWPLEGGAADLTKAAEAAEPAEAAEARRKVARKKAARKKAARKKAASKEAASKKAASKKAASKKAAEQKKNNTKKKQPKEPELGSDFDDDLYDFSGPDDLSGAEQVRGVIFMLCTLLVFLVCFECRYMWAYAYVCMCTCACVCMCVRVVDRVQAQQRRQALWELVCVGY
jgi:hypothetical protein